MLVFKVNKQLILIRVPSTCKWYNGCRGDLALDTNGELILIATDLL